VLDWVDHPVLLIVLIVTNAPLYRIFAEMFFGSREGVEDALWYWLMPDWIWLLHGEWWDAQWAELKLFVYTVLCIATVAAEYTALSKAMQWLQA
jgi:hypothetical protein